MDRLYVRFQDLNLLDFDGTCASIAALKADVEAMAFDVSQFVEAQIQNLISEDTVTETMLACILYRIFFIEDLPVGGNYAISIVPDVEIGQSTRERPVAPVLLR